jgi:hypothetical protein
MLVFALVLTLGFHWAWLQTAAWTTMLASNLRTHSWSESVARTFDGAHPCCLCRAIAAAKQTEKKSEASAPVFKLDFLLPADRFFFSPPAPESAFSQTPLVAVALPSSPPSPPPKAVQL